MVDTAFLRSDELPGRAALGYLAVDGLRTTCSTCPCAAAGTAAPTRRWPTCSGFWDALLAGRIVSPGRSPRCCDRTATGPRSTERYGLGFHLHATSDTAWLEGYDAGVSFASVHRPSSSTTYTVISNWTDGAWPVVGR